MMYDTVPVPPVVPEGGLLAPRAARAAFPYSWGDTLHMGHEANNTQLYKYKSSNCR